MNPSAGTINLSTEKKPGGNGRGGYRGKVKQTISIYRSSVESTFSISTLRGSCCERRARSALDAASSGRKACTRERTDVFQSKIQLGAMKYAWRYMIHSEGEACLRSAGGSTGNVFLSPKSNGGREACMSLERDSIFIFVKTASETGINPDTNIKCKSKQQ